MAPVRRRAGCPGNKELCNDPAPALHFAEAVDMSEISVVGLLTLASPTMMDAFAQLNRYGQLVVEVDLGASPRFALEQRSGELWMVDPAAFSRAFKRWTGASPRGARAPRP